MPNSIPRRAILLSPAALALARLSDSRAESRSHAPAGLRRGLSASFWFEWPPGDEASIRRHLATKYRANDWPVIRNLGFDHIRVPIQPGVLSPGLRNGDPVLDPARIRLFDSALAEITGAGLNMVVDCHPAAAVKAKMAGDATYFALIERWWQILAAHITAHPSYHRNRIFLELLNEPEDSFNDASHYKGLMARLISSVRRAAPDTTLLVGGNRWNTPEALYQGLKTPFEDRNIVYVFHFYKPMTFTHQGLDNAGGFYGKLRGVPWNFDAGHMPEETYVQSDPSVRQSLQRYAASPNREEDLTAPFEMVRNWCDRHGCSVWLGEFGVYKIKAPPTDRAAWVGAVRRQAERHGFGWNMWEAVGGFGLFSRSSSGTLEPDTAILQALGMTT